MVMSPLNHDVALCVNQNCPSALKCLRYLTRRRGPTNYAEFTVLPGADSCEFFIPAWGETPDAQS